MNSAMGNKLSYGIVVAIVSVLVIVVLSIWQYQRIQDTSVIIRQANRVLYQTQAVQSAETQYELNARTSCSRVIVVFYGWPGIRFKYCRQRSIS
jgi:CHASE3 domain sensor protein